MRYVFVGGLAAAVAFVVVNRAFVLLNARSDWSVAAGYFLLLGLVSAAAGLVSRMWRRR